MKISINKNTFLFYIGVFLLILSSTFIVNINNKLFFYTKVISYLFFILNFLLEKKNIRNILNLIIFFLVCLLAFYLNRNTDIITFALVGISCVSVNFNKTIIIQLVSKILGIILTLTSYALGYSKDVIMMRDNGQIRHSLGFIHPNSFATHVAYTSLMYFIIRKKKITQFELFIITVLNVIVSQITGTRTSLFVIILGVLLIIFSKLVNSNFFSIFDKINWFYLFGAISIIFSIFYIQYSNLINSIDVLFSGRLRQGSFFLYKYGLSIFGQFIQTGQENTIGIENGRIYILDNMYVKLVVQYGCILTAYFIGYFNHLRKTFKYDFVIQVCLLLLALYGVSESSPIKVETNFFLFGIGNWVKCSLFTLKEKKT